MTPIGNVLIVEDDADTREMLATLLSMEGFHAVAAEDGLEALHLLRTVRHRAPDIPCLVLLDLKLPKVDGLEVLKEIRATEHLKLIPVVVLTTSQAEQDIFGTYDLELSAQQMDDDAGNLIITSGTLKEIQ